MMPTITITETNPEVTQAEGGGGRQTIILTETNPERTGFAIVQTDPATLVAANTATPNGTLNDDGGEACDCGFEWGETIAYGNTTPTQSRTSGQTFAQTITGLTPGQTYHFRAFASNLAGTAYGADQEFTTVLSPESVSTGAMLLLLS